MRLTIFLLVISVIPIAAYSTVIEVPKDYTTIQAAIDAAQNGDTVLVAPGTYIENINFNGKGISVVSGQGPILTIIKGNSNWSVVTFNTFEGPNSVLKGFTITNGKGAFYSGKTHGCGGGVFCFGSAPIIEGNVITQNSAKWGGGVYCDSASPEIRENTISDNDAEAAGGIYCFNSSSPLIANNKIISNHVLYGAAGIYCADTSSSNIIGNYIYMNSASLGCGGGIISESDIFIHGNIIAKNRCGQNGGGLLCFLTAKTIISNNLIVDNLAYWEGGGICSNGPSGSTVQLINNTITKNSAMGWIGLPGGGGLKCAGATTISLTNTILYGNSSPYGGSELYLGGNATTCMIEYSDVRGNPINDTAYIHVDPGSTLNWGAGNIDADPLFVKSGLYEGHLTFPSPCRDTGSNTLITALNDFENDPRIVNGIADIGADEFHTHLYYTGIATPGGSVFLNFIDVPNTTPVILWIGSGLLAPPFHSKKYGDWFLQPPVLLTIPLGAIPQPAGVISCNYTIALNFPLMDIPMQALIGNKLTNACLLQIR